MCQVALRNEVAKLGPESTEAIYCFGIEEGETFCLCRWLRARKFNVTETLALIAKAVALRAEPSKHHYYPEERARSSTIIQLFPQMYTGTVARNNALIYVSKPGQINVEGMECFTDLDGIVRFHWYIMHHDFGSRLRAQQKQILHPSSSLRSSSKSKFQ